MTEHTNRLAVIDACLARVNREIQRSLDMRDRRDFHFFTAQRNTLVCQRARLLQQQRDQQTDADPAA